MTRSSTNVFGSQFDLAEQIQTHLFIISPNNSGSTFLKNVLATSRHTWNLAREGQHTKGFQGPSSSNQRLPLLWAARPEWIERFTDATSFNWAKTRDYWYFQSFARDSNATVFVEKSPPFLLNVAQLSEHFRDARFLFLLRNPYAVVEGILRRCRKRPRDWFEQLHPATAAARHVATCMQKQKENIERFGTQGTFFTYEQMCEQANDVQGQIQKLVPRLDDLRLNQQVSVKGMYDEPLRNMNGQQISRLTVDEFRLINQVFDGHQDLLRGFGYERQDCVRSADSQAAIAS